MRTFSAILFATLAISILVSAQIKKKEKLRFSEKFKWSHISYVLPSEVTDDEYDKNVNIPMGASHWKDKIFITVPRRRYGVPSTLNYVPLDSEENRDVPLLPYPNFSINRFTNGTFDDEENGLVSVYRTTPDVCDRLWLVDTGIIEIPGNLQQIKPTALVLIDLKTNKIIHRFPVPVDLLRANTNLASVTVDVTSSKCDSAYAYLPDLAGYALIVFNLKTQQFWRMTHNYFFLEPTGGEFFIGGFNFQWNDGIFGLALSEKQEGGHRTAYFHAMAGLNEYKVSTNIFKNETLATRGYHYDNFTVVGNKGPEFQTSGMDIHQKSGIAFLALINKNAIGCWNTKKNKKIVPGTVQILQAHNQTMIYPSDVKVDTEDNVWVLTNTMPVFLYGHLSYTNINFRVWTAPVTDAVKGTSCEARHGLLG